MGRGTDSNALQGSPDAEVILSRPPKRLTQRSLKQVLTDVEKHLEYCWALLASGKESNSGSELIFDFQPRLMKALGALSDAYRCAKTEETTLINRKSQLNQDWFRNRMSQLSSYRKALCRAISISKNLGNAFAWIFYNKSPALIGEHLLHQPQLLLPPGTGGIGERVFAEKFQHLDRKLVLHHAITSFLRIGDFSIVDPFTHKVACIGEIKTVQTGPQEVQLSLNLITGSREDMPFQNLEVRQLQTESELPQKIKSRLERQVKTMGDALKKARDLSQGDRLQRESKFHLKELEELVETCGSKRFSFRRIGDGLLLGAVKLGKEHALAKNFLSRGGNPSALLGGVEKEVLSIMKEGAPDNALWIGSHASEHGYPEFHRGMTPLPLWSISAQARRLLIFEEVLLMSFYNPAHFHDKLRASGYVLELGPKSHLKKAERRVGKRIQVFENSSYFYAAITKYLLSEEDVIEILERTSELLESKGLDVATRMDIELQLHM